MICSAIYCGVSSKVSRSLQTCDICVMMMVVVLMVMMKIVVMMLVGNGDDVIVVAMMIFHFLNMLFQYASMLITLSIYIQSIKFKTRQYNLGI